MILRWQVALGALGVMALGIWCTPARADERDKRTTMSFNQPVEVPGHVLIPGRYVFQLADLQADRNVVQVFSEDHRGMDHLVTMSFAVPDYRLNVTSDPVVTFEERHADSPEAIHSWFYPGEHDGWQFVYPKSQTLLSAANTTPPPAPVSQPAPAATPAPQQTAATSAPQQTAAAAPAPAPAQPPVQVAQNHPPAATPQPPPQEPAAPKQLPQTASELPLAELLGVVMLALGGGLLGYGLYRARA